MDNLLTPAESTSSANSDYNRLIASIQSLDPREGVRLLKQFLQTYPSFAQGHNDLSVLLLQAGNQTLALAHQEKACRLQPENVTFRKNLADFYAVKLGWYDDAVDIYLDILKKNPRDTDALIALGNLGSAMEKGAHLDTSAYFEIEAPAATPASPQATLPPLPSFEERYTSARNLAESGNTREAFTQLRELAQHQPGNAVIQNDLGVLSYNLGDIEAARMHYENAVRLDPSDATFARNLADLYFTELGRQDDAIRIYLDLHTNNPRDIETLMNLGHICASVGRPDEAASFYKRALEIEPWNSDARQCLNTVLQKPAPPSQQPLKTAEELHAEALQAVADNRTNEAISLLRGLTQTYPHHAVGHNDLGVLLYQCGDITGAATAYTRAVELQPGNSNFRKNLADLCFVELDKTDEAIQMYLEMFREQPRDIEILMALGHICAAVGRPDEAKTFYRRVLEIEPWNIESREALRAIA